MKRGNTIYTNYYATEDGKVWNEKTGEEVKGFLKKEKGYWYLSLPGHKNIRKHRFIWESFNGPIPQFMVINHLDGNKNNNAEKNLELTTPKGNAQHASKLGLLNYSKKRIVIKEVTQNKIYRSVRQAELLCGLYKNELNRYLTAVKKDRVKLRNFIFEVVK